MILGRYRQHPNDRRLRELNYDDFLENGEVITSVAASVSPATDTPFVVGTFTIDVGGRKVAYFSSGGEHGQTYEVTFNVQTSASQRKNDTVEFDVEEDE